MRAAVAFHGCHRRGGVERVMYECVNYLAERGHEVHALAGTWDDSEYRRGVARHNVQHISWPPAMGMLSYSRSLRRALEPMCADLDVVASFGATAPPGSVTWMQSVHAAWMETARQTRDFKGRIRQRANPFHPVALRLERSLLRERRYRRVIALTSDVKADIMTHYDVPASDIDIVPNGYSAREFYVSPEEDRRRMRDSLGLKEDDRVVIFVANELERKGFRPLAQAIAGAPDAQIKLLAVGGFSISEAQGIVREFGAKDRIVLVGPTNDIHSYYAAADYFALPTKYEAWGLVIVEAMASGLPTLTSAGAGAAVAVQEGVNGTLVEDPTSPDSVADGLAQLLQIETTPEAISASVSGYEWSRILREYENVLDRARSS